MWMPEVWNKMGFLEMAINKLTGSKIVKTHKGYFDDTSNILDIAATE